MTKKIKLVKPGDFMDGPQGLIPLVITHDEMIHEMAHRDQKPTKTKPYKQGEYRRCYHDHSGMKIRDNLPLIYGGSCYNPTVKDADIYVGFDQGMERHDKYPWEEGKKVIDICFPIQDQRAPKNAEQFKKMTNWVGGMMYDGGMKVHVGCAGGHGRTGTFLAALVAQMTGNKDAIEYVRKNYCEKAVESEEQVRFLMKHYGCNYAQPHREKYVPEEEHRQGVWSTEDFKPVYPSIIRGDNGYDYAVTPQSNSPLTVWGSNVRFDKPNESGTIKK